MDPFTTLGFARAYDLDKTELERRYRDLQQALHPDKHKNAPASERSMTLSKAVEVNEAYRVLRDDARRAEALLVALSGGPVASEPDREVADPELLMEMMELREALSDAREAGAADQVAKLAAQVHAAVDEVSAKLPAAFAEAAGSNGQAALARARVLVSRLRYYRRFLDEVAVFEDEALSSHAS